MRTKLNFLREPTSSGRQTVTEVLLLSNPNIYLPSPYLVTSVSLKPILILLPGHSICCVSWLTLPSLPDLVCFYYLPFPNRSPVFKSSGTALQCPYNARMPPLCFYSISDKGSGTEIRLEWLLTHFLPQPGPALVHLES